MQSRSNWLRYMFGTDYLVVRIVSALASDQF